MRIDWDDEAPAELNAGSGRLVPRVDLMASESNSKTASVAIAVLARWHEVCPAGPAPAPPASWAPGSRIVYFVSKFVDLRQH
jgi:hypothetical protein